MSVLLNREQDQRLATMEVVVETSDVAPHPQAADAESRTKAVSPMAIDDDDDSSCPDQQLQQATFENFNNSSVAQAPLQTHDEFVDHHGAVFRKSPQLTENDSTVFPQRQMTPQKRRLSSGSDDDGSGGLEMRSSLPAPAKVCSTDISNNDRPIVAVTLSHSATTTTTTIDPLSDQTHAPKQSELQCQDFLAAGRDLTLKRGDAAACSSLPAEFSKIITTRITSPPSTGNGSLSAPETVDADTSSHHENADEDDDAGTRHKLCAASIYREEFADFDLHVSFCSTAGDRPHMEDVCVHTYNYYKHCPEWAQPARPYHFLGVFDGHGGRQASEFASNYLLDFITQQANFWRYDDDCAVMQAIYDGFLRCHVIMWKYALPKWPLLANGHRSTAGTTASIAVLRGKKLYIGHVGDSGIVMVERVPPTPPATLVRRRPGAPQSGGGSGLTMDQADESGNNVFDDAAAANGDENNNSDEDEIDVDELEIFGPRRKRSAAKASNDANVLLPTNKRSAQQQQQQPSTLLCAQRLTDDHKPEAPEELERIQAAGGSVRSKQGVHRVVWKRPLMVPVVSPQAMHRTNMGLQLRHQQQQQQQQQLVVKYSIIPFLAVARSLGDFWSYNVETNDFIVSPAPDVSCINLQWPRHRGLVVGSDGLWNFCKPEEAVELVEEVDRLREMWLWQMSMAKHTKQHYQRSRLRRQQRKRNKKCRRERQQQQNGECPRRPASSVSSSGGQKIGLPVCNSQPAMQLQPQPPSLPARRSASSLMIVENDDEVAVEQQKLLHIRASSAGEEQQQQHRAGSSLRRSRHSTGLSSASSTVNASNTSYSSVSSEDDCDDDDEEKTDDDDGITPADSTDDDDADTIEDNCNDADDAATDRSFSTTTTTDAESLASIDLDYLQHEANEVNVADCIIHKVVGRCSARHLRADNVASFVVLFEPKATSNIVQGAGSTTSLPSETVFQIPDHTNVIPITSVVDKESGQLERSNYSNDEYSEAKSLLLPEQTESMDVKTLQLQDDNTSNTRFTRSVSQHPPPMVNGALQLMKEHLHSQYEQIKLLCCSTQSSLLKSNEITLSPSSSIYEKQLNSDDAVSSTAGGIFLTTPLNAVIKYENTLERVQNLLRPFVASDQQQQDAAAVRQQFLANAVSNNGVQFYLPNNSTVNQHLLDLAPTTVTGSDGKIIDAGPVLRPRTDAEAAEDARIAALQDEMRASAATPDLLCRLDEDDVDDNAKPAEVIVAHATIDDADGGYNHTAEIIPETPPEQQASNAEMHDTFNIIAENPMDSGVKAKKDARSKRRHPHRSRRRNWQRRLYKQLHIHKASTFGPKQAVQRMLSQVQANLSVAHRALVTTSVAATPATALKNGARLNNGSSNGISDALVHRVMGVKALKKNALSYTIPNSDGLQKRRLSGSLSAKFDYAAYQPPPLPTPVATLTEQHSLMPSHYHHNACRSNQPSMPPVGGLASHRHRHQHHYDNATRPAIQPIRTPVLSFLSSASPSSSLAPAGSAMAAARAANYGRGNNGGIYEGNGAFGSGLNLRHPPGCATDGTVVGVRGDSRTVTTGRSAAAALPRNGDADEFAGSVTRGRGVGRGWDGSNGARRLLGP